MNIIKGFGRLIIIILLVLGGNTAFSQVVVEKSNEKISISGIPYYLHQVKKGETAYSISRAYGISVEELTKENPPALYGVKEGQSLRIPVRSVTEKKVEPSLVLKIQKDETKFIYHILQPGQTVYSLSKSYGVSENEIIQSNPGIDINKLSVGYEIAIPRRVFMSDRQNFDDQENKYIYHKVVQGESLASIAEKYGLSVRVLRRENRDLRFPQVGDFVRIPGVELNEPEVIIPVIADTVAAAVEETVVEFERPAGFTPVTNLKGSLNVAVLLPFYLKENSKRIEIDSSKIVRGKRQYKLNKKADEWIYPASLDFLEMYEGILLAADTLRTLGLDINIYAYDIKDDTIGITSLIRSGKLSGMDLIIGPVYSHILTIVSDYASMYAIPVVSPVTLMNNSVLINHPTLFMANSSLEVAQRALAKRISENYDKNLVFIHSDTSRTDYEILRFKAMIFDELSYRLPYDEIKFKEFIFYSRSMFDNDSINRLSHALSENSENIVIIASDDTPVISESISEIHGLSKRFNVKVFGYPSMLDLDNLDPKVFFDLDLMVLSPYWIDYTRSNVKHFNYDFRRKFLTEPMERSYAWQGYDIAYYFLSGLGINGREFILHPERHYPELLQADFDFVRKSEDSGFENQKLFMVRYTNDYEVKLIKGDSVLMQK